MHDEVTILVDALPVAVVVVEAAGFARLGVDRVLGTGVGEIALEAVGQTAQPVRVEQAAQSDGTLAFELIDDRDGNQLITHDPG